MSYTYEVRDTEGSFTLYRTSPIQQVVTSLVFVKPWDRSQNLKNLWLGIRGTILKAGAVWFWGTPEDIMAKYRGFGARAVVYYALHYVSGDPFHARKSLFKKFVYNYNASNVPQEVTNVGEQVQGDP